MQLASQSHKILERGADAYAIPAVCYRHRGGPCRVDRARARCAGPLRAYTSIPPRSRCPGHEVRRGNGYADRHCLLFTHHGRRHLRAGIGLRLSSGRHFSSGGPSAISSIRRASRSWRQRSVAERTADRRGRAPEGDSGSTLSWVRMPQSRTTYRSQRSLSSTSVRRRR